MKKYEIMFILDPKEDSAELKNSIKNLFKEHGATILSEQDMGLKKMAYPIQKKDRGVYYLLNAELDPAKNEFFKRELNLKESVMRYMFINLSEI